MLLCHSMPTVTATAYATSLAGGGFLGGTEDGLTDGLPARVARLAWPSTAGDPTDWISIQLTFSRLSALRVVALLGVTLPAGVLIEVDLLDGSTVVGSVSQRLVALPPGQAIGAWLVFDAGTPASDGVRVRILNDVGGSTAIAADAVFEIGELVAMRATDVRLQADWGMEPVDPSEATLTRDSQLAVVDREPYRRFEGNLSAGSFAEVYGAGLAGTDWTRLQAMLARDGRCAAIPRWTSDGTAVVPSKVAATAVYGRGAIGRFVHLGGDWYSATLTVQELPAYAPEAGSGGDAYVPTAVEWLGISWSQSTAFSGLVATEANMRDSDYTTGGATGVAFTPSWIQADLGAVRSVNRVTLAGGTLAGWGGVADYLNGRKVQVSVDGSTWTDVATAAGFTDSAPQAAEVSFSVVAARYVRLVTPAISEYLATTEFRVYGPAE